MFKIGGKAVLPPAPVLEKLPIDPPASTASPAVIAAGGERFGRFCGVCHGDAAVGGTLVPDLRRSGVINDAATWQAVVHDGALKANGMVSFASVMSAPEIETVRQYVIKRANEDKALELRQSATRASNYGK